MKTLTYVHHDSTDVYWNFGLEYYLLDQRPFGDVPIFLFWRTTPTLMIGKYQNLYQEINTDYVRRHQIHLVRRLSGGGTIYTDLGGWQFSFIQPQAADQIEFQDFIRPVVGALRALGADASFSGRNDLEIGGRKFSGNAQYKLKGQVVHHGSLLFDTDLDAIVKSTTVADYKIVSKGIQSVRERVTNIREHLPQDLSVEQFRWQMIAYLTGQPDCPRDQLHYLSLSQEQIDQAERMAKLHFRGADSLHRREPAFTLERSGRFEGGHVTLKLQIERQTILAADISGDFFGTLERDEFAEILRDCPFTREAVGQRLAHLNLDAKLYRITLAELLDLIL